MGIITNRRRVMGGKPLPYDAEVEYIESDGRQYLNTEIIPTPSTKSIIKVCILSYSPSCIYGNRAAETYDYRMFLTANRGVFFDYPTNYRINTSSIGIVLDKTLEIELGNNYIKNITDDLVAVSADIMNANSTLPICLDNPAGLGTKNKWYPVAIMYDNLPVFDGIPVRKNGDGYIYDRISDKLFGSATTYQYISGPDKT